MMNDSTVSLWEVRAVSLRNGKVLDSELFEGTFAATIPAVNAMRDRHACLTAVVYLERA